MGIKAADTSGAFCAFPHRTSEEAGLLLFELSNLTVKDQLGRAPKRGKFQCRLQFYLSSGCLGARDSFFTENFATSVTTAVTRQPT